MQQRHKKTHRHNCSFHLNISNTKVWTSCVHIFQNVTRHWMVTVTKTVIERKEHSLANGLVQCTGNIVRCARKLPLCTPMLHPHSCFHLHLPDYTLFSRLSGHKGAPLDWRPPRTSANVVGPFKPRQHTHFLTAGVLTWTRRKHT